MEKPDVKVIGFDADDTLWVNEPYYREAEISFLELMEPYAIKKNIAGELFKTEMNNLPLYGYGIKSFMLSMVECALKVTEGKLRPHTLDGILDIGRTMLGRPIELLDHVKEVIRELAPRYRLIVATKGDLLDQEKKMHASGIAPYFHHIEVMTEKKEQNYIRLLDHLDIEPCQFLMIGNSLRSDIMPPLNLGAYAIHVPYHTTWAYEEVEEEPVSGRFARMNNLLEILHIL